MQEELNFVSPNWWLLRNGEKAKVLLQTSDNVKSNIRRFTGLLQNGKPMVWNHLGLALGDKREYDLMEQLRGEGNIADVTTK